jgi:hypothetical protein
MQIKFTRSARQGGMLGGKTVYQLNALLMPTEEEDELITKYKRWGNFIPTMRIVADMEDTKAPKPATLQELRHGTTFEHENFNVIYRLEDAIIEECQSAIATCEALDTFNGTSRVVEVNRKDAELVAVG